MTLRATLLLLTAASTTVLAACSSSSSGDSATSPGTSGAGGSGATGGGAGTSGKGGSQAGTGGSTAGKGGTSAGSAGTGGAAGATAGAAGTAGNGGGTAGAAGSAGVGGGSAGNGGSTAGNGGSTAGNGGSTAGTGGSTAGNGGSTAGSGGSTAGNGGAAGSGGQADPCALKASCQAVDKTCVGLVDNTGKTKFGLRMSQLDFTFPVAFTSGIAKQTIEGAVPLDDKTCNQGGTGFFSWLLQPDTAAKTVRMGGARPVVDPSMGYSFDDEIIGGLHVQPVVVNDASAPSGNFATAAADLVMPIFLNGTGTSFILLPLHQARVTDGSLSSSGNCIGLYNSAGLDPINSCLPDSTHPAFLTAASVDAYITLEEADGVIVAAISQSLCVLLSGNATMYGTQMGANTVCKRNSSNVIQFAGDWCAATNAPASPTCSDAVRFAGKFAASSVAILN